ncbi:MAG: hypothetical protein C0608_08910 [Deltaproteobacteria bacterium]|nr:MAG: hypothetical protein C0608_08910 [Deltaproteobacteria bacterium]
MTPPKDNLFIPTPRKRVLSWLVRFALFNVAVVALLLLRYASSIPEISGPLARTFFVLSVPAHAFSIVIIATILPALFALIWPSRSIVTTIAVVINIAICFTLLVDTEVFRLYRFHLNAMVWELLTGGAASETLPISSNTWLTIAAALLGLLLVEGGGATWIWLTKGRPAKNKLVLISLFATLVGANSIHAWADAKAYTPVVSQVRYFPAYMPLTSKRFLRKLGVETAKAEGSAKVKLKGNLAYPASPLIHNGEAPEKNILVIMLDGWREDGLAPEVTPNIWKFSEGALNFTNHYSSGNATRFGTFGLFYGINSNYWHAALAEGKGAVLVEEAANLGYRFGIFSSAQLDSPEFDRTIFNSIREELDVTTEGANAVSRDLRITEKFKGFLAKDDASPFFSLIFYDSPHSYAIPDGYPAPFTPYAEEVNHLALDADTDPLPLKNKLKNSYHFVDSLVGEVLDEVKAKGLLEKTVIVITGDHGEEFNDNGLSFWGHNSSFSPWQTRVPFILHWPGKGPDKITRRTSHVDLAPTLMSEVLGFEAQEEKYSNGASLFGDEARAFLFVGSWGSYGLIGDDWTIVSLPSGELEYRDGNYQPGEKPQRANEVLLSALKQMSLFFEK